MGIHQGFVSTSAASCLALLLAGCGGGSGGGSGSSGSSGSSDGSGSGGGAPTTAPSPDAGMDQAVIPGATVTLNGTAGTHPDSASLTYLWTQSGGSPVELSSATSSQPTFTAPQQPDRLTFALTIRNGTVDSTADSVTISVVDPSTVSFSNSPTPTTTLSHGDAASFRVTATDAEGYVLPGYEVAFGPAGFTVTPEGTVSWRATSPLFQPDTSFRWGVRLTGVPSALMTGTITVTDASRQYPLRRTDLYIPVQNSGLRVADLDGDGASEVLVGSRQALYVLSRNGTTYEQSWVYPFDPVMEHETNRSTDLQAVTSADINGDGKQEIFFSKAGQLVRLDGVTRRETARVQLRCRSLAVADINRDSVPEVVCLGTNTGSHHGTDGRIVVLNATTLAEIWTTPDIGAGRTMAVGNVDGDAALEIVTASGIVLDGATRQIEWTYSQPFGTEIDVGDMDGDGIDEIIGIGQSAGATAYSAVLRSPIWQYTNLNWDLDAIIVTDVNGDGQAEAIIGDGQWGEVTGISFNSTSQQPELAWTINSQDHGVTSIAVGDVDADGVNEIIWGSGATSSGRDDLVIAGFTPSLSVKWQSSSLPTINGYLQGAALARIGGGASRLMFTADTQTRNDFGLRAIALTPMTGALEFSNPITSHDASTPPHTVTDYDNDGIDELLFGSSNGFFGAYDFAANSIEWQSPRSSNDRPRLIRQADMNSDGHEDLVGMTVDGYIEIHDVMGNSLLWRSTQLGPGIALDVSDLNNDGKQEIIVATTSRIIVYEKNEALATYLERASIQHENAVDLVAADLHGESNQSIYLISQRFWEDHATLTVFDADLQPLNSIVLGTRASAIYVEKSDFSRKNLLLGVTRDQNYPSNTELWAIDPASGTDIWRSPLLVGMLTRGSLQFVDLDGDGIDEIAFSTYLGMYHTR